MKASPSERIAGLAFFAFVLIQVPFFTVDTPLSPHGFVMLSPLQVTAAEIVRYFPDLEEAVNFLLVPGGWMRDSLAPFLRCQFKTSGQGPCGTYAAKLHDFEHIKNANNLPMLLELLDKGISNQSYILYGGASIVVSALFSLLFTVKTAVLGFLLLGYGVVQGNHTPLPPAVLMAFLVVYAGFNLEGMSARRTARQRQQQRQQQQGLNGNSSSVANGSSSSGTKAGASVKKGQAAPSAKQRKQKRQA